MYIKPTCVTYDQGSAQRSLPAVMFKPTLFWNNTRMFNKLTIGTLDHVSLLLLDNSFNHLTPNLVILLDKTFDSFNCWPWNWTPFQNSRIGRFGRWQQQRVHHTRDDWLTIKVFPAPGAVFYSVLTNCAVFHSVTNIYQSLNLWHPARCFILC